MECMKDLFYLHEVIAQTLENYPLKLKEKDFSIHKLRNSGCFSEGMKKKSYQLSGLSLPSFLSSFTSM